MKKSSVSIGSIGTEILKKEKELRSAKRGMTVAQQKRINLKIKALHKHYSALKMLCVGWKVG